MKDIEQSAIAAVLEQGCAAYGNEPMCELAVLLSMLRSTSFIHQAHHWQTRGPQYYGDHLLYERLYTELAESIDGLAERAVGAGDYPLVNPVVSSKQMSDMIRLVCNGSGQTPEQYVVQSLKSVAATLGLLRLVYDALGKKKMLTHGIENLLQGVADKLEGQVYLLKQRARSK